MTSIVNKKKPIIIAIILTIAIFIWSYYSENIFSFGEINEIGYKFSKVLFPIFLFPCIYFLVNFAFLLKKREQDVFYKKWLKFTLIIVIFYLIFQVLVWPGIFVWDEFFIFKSASSFIIEYWQSYLTSLFYIFSLYIFPSMATAVIIQILFFSFILGWILAKLEMIYHLGKWNYFILSLFLLSPCVLYSNFTTYRSTMLAFFEFWLIALLFFSFKDNRFTYKTVALISFLTIFLSYWRQEGIYHLIMVPIACFFIFGKLNMKKYILLLGSTFLGFIIILNAYSIVDKNDSYVKMKYSLTAYINPLSMILIDKNSKIDSESIEKIDKVVDIDKLKEMSFPYDIPGFWNGAVREGFSEEDFSQFKKQFYKIAIDNIDLFLSSRSRTYLGSSGFSTYGFYPNDYITWSLAHGESIEALDTLLVNKYNQPTDLSTRNITTKILEFTRRPINSLFFWNFTPVLLLLIIIAVRVRKVKDPFLWLSLIVITRVPLIFLTAPGSYYMYYYPMVLAGMLILIFYILDILKQKKLSKDIISIHMVEKNEK